MLHEAAETLALEALAAIAGDDKLRDALMAQSGLSPADLRARAGDADFLGFVLDFLLQNEAALVAFAAARGMAPEAVARARAALPGGPAEEEA